MTPLTPLSSPPPGTDVNTHALGVLDFLIKLSAALGAIWVTVTKIAKPYTKWRRAHIAELVRDVLAPELQHLAELRDGDGRVRRLCHEILDGQALIMARQDQMFREMDLLHHVATENSERHDEMNLLLDELGFSSDRRRATAEDQRKRVSVLLLALKTRKLKRDRGEEDDEAETGGDDSDAMRIP